MQSPAYDGVSVLSTFRAGTSLLLPCSGQDSAWDGDGDSNSNSGVDGDVNEVKRVVIIIEADEAVTTFEHDLNRWSVF